MCWSVRRQAPIWKAVVIIPAESKSSAACSTKVWTSRDYVESESGQLLVVDFPANYFPADFYVLDMEDDASEEGSTLILGQPFFMIVKTKIDVHVGTLSMEIEDTYVEFNIFEALKHPTKDHSTFGIDTIDELSQSTNSINSRKNVSPQPQTTELKSLPEHLKYSYLGDNQQFSVIIANNLNEEQEENLLEVLKKHKRAIN
ncbi:hypothetical protein CR513_10010, partial [Mucuna pruriens]